MWTYKHVGVHAYECGRVIMNGYLWTDMHEHMHMDKIYIWIDRRAWICTMDNYLVVICVCVTKHICQTKCQPYE